jgi:2-haloacid dehalogenase
LIPEQTLFIDDNFRNIEAAAKMGIVCHHFQGPEKLGEFLHASGMIN